jgi:hypothetical protein
LQDTETANVWKRLRGTKDDHYIYRSDSILDRFFDYEGEVRFDVLSEEGKQNLRAAVIAAGGLSTQALIAGG